MVLNNFCQPYENIDVLLLSPPPLPLPPPEVGGLRLRSALRLEDDDLFEGEDGEVEGGKYDERSELEDVEGEDEGEAMIEEDEVVGDEGGELEEEGAEEEEDDDEADNEG